MSDDVYTRAAHPPDAPVPAQRPIGLPTYRSSAFVFATQGEYSDVLGNRADGYVYSRIDNPTVDAFGLAVAALEGAEAAQCFASGMAAISTTLLTFLSAGDHVVAQSSLYGGTHSLFEHVLPRFGIATTRVSSPEEAAAAVRPETRLVYGETIANPTLDVCDLQGFAAVARDAGAVFVVDSTFASPVVCRPLEWGADVVLHSATKFLGGHTDATGGVALGSRELMTKVRGLRSDLGGSMAPDEAFLLHRGTETLPLRVDRQCESALAFATALAEHPAIEAVAYPGLPNDPSHAVATKQFDSRRGSTRYGAVVTVSPRGGREAGVAMCDGLRLAYNATSLGGTVTKVSHVASTTHRQLDDAALAAAGILPSAVRVSIGLEDPDDLVADFTAALR
ncbi:MAG TPA: aminotransferase class I/II-fold pyridoxal phosphate-dependent enzyme [Frankiaceae bacterium]|jgi:O-acetylhomoserine/O-acetylserine sulfhydrylase-like pyridoxal-dependent enzyme|nr:aminotransferase class I/II-fold pyridoxal phosphate-dependent enzyme [Frankiaceae bacterium]